MSTVRIAKVGDYGDCLAIRSFVRDALSMGGHADFLGAGGPPRLVVVKPNWIQEAHEHKPDIWEPVITHPSVVLAVVEELAEAMRGEGTICVCDAPHAYANFDAILARGGLSRNIHDLRRRWPNLSVELLDLRRETFVLKEGVVVERKPNPDDPRGYVAMNLGKESLFFGHGGEGRYYGADYDTNVVNSHHHGETHEYLLAGSPMKCSLFINLPKMKTHKKTGITCSLKNLVGINGDKNWLPHHTQGTPDNGGDEFPRTSCSVTIERHLKRLGMNAALKLPMFGPWFYRRMRNLGKSALGDSETVIRNGNWAGNDTCWRMALDLNRALIFGNVDGTWRESDSPKRYLAIVDGIVGGQGNGPLCPDPIPAGVLLCGTNPATVDAAVARMMRFDLEQLPIIANTFQQHRWPIADCGMDKIVIEDTRSGKTLRLADLEPVAPEGFRPHFGWRELRKLE